MRLPAQPREEDFTSRLRGAAVAARVGLWLGICFVLAFVTGLFSHFSQDTPAWLTLPTRPVALYRWSQGLHVVAGSAAVPLLLVKLWTVYPRLFAPIPRRGRALLVAALERGSIAVLVSGAIFELMTGLQNSAQWYPWRFDFRGTHYAIGWITIGALLCHVAVKLPVIRTALGSDVEAPQPTDRKSMAQASTGLTRRGLLRTTWLASGAAVVTTAGIAVPWLSKVSVFGVRSGDGPQSLPVNKSAYAAGVTASALDPSYRLVVMNGGRRRTMSRAELLAMPQTTRTLPIACVEGWSVSATWTGIRLRELLRLVGSGDDVDIVVRSLQQGGSYSVMDMPANFVRDDDTLLALKVNGDDLAVDHGFPCRIIAAARPGVLQTKWVASIEVAS
jgi:DMSO/TMAO reductase YedYZ molybdopterin-dependent catalytic subunit